MATILVIIERPDLTDGTRASFSFVVEKCGDVLPRKTQLCILTSWIIRPRQAFSIADNYLHTASTSSRRLSFQDAIDSALRSILTIVSSLNEAAIRRLVISF